MKKEYETITLRLPPGLRQKLAEDAEKEFRSMNLHAVALLAAATAPKRNTDKEV